MEDSKIRYCKLCLTPIHGENYEAIENVTNDILGSLSLKLEVDDENKLIVCNICSGKLLAAQKFKSTCLITDNTISSYSNDTTTLPLDLREIYINILISLDIKICRLCMQPIEDKLELKPINGEQVNMIQKFVPEMNVYIIKEPVMCKLCLDSLVEHCNFLKKCSDVERNLENISRQISDVPSLMPSDEISVKIESVDAEFEEDLPELVKTECLNVDFVKTEDTSEVHGQEIPVKAAVIQKFICEICNYGTTHNSLLRRHMLVHKHRSEMEFYKCETCNYETNHKTNLKRHMLIHKDPSEVQMYKCKKCSYETKHKTNLKNHMLLHKDSSSKMQMYKCDLCKFETVYKGVLVTHMLIHKNPSEVEMYKCEYCIFETKYKPALKKHMSIHNDSSEMQMYKCAVCNFETKYKVNLQSHMLVHKDPSKMQTHKCNTCTFQTIYKSALNRHMLVHRDPSEVQMYKCDNCVYESKYKAPLKRHMLLHKDSNRQT